MKSLSKLFVPALIASLTLGLAPFQPEPHLWQKFQWIAEGQALKWKDIFDILMHGTPWVLLILSGVGMIQLKFFQGRGES